MLVLIMGGSGSGKSAYAEERISQMAGTRKKYYLATMQVFDEETKAKAKKHRKARSGKGFVTIERPTSVCGALEKMKGSAALLECMSNLVANEMFSGDMPVSPEMVAEKVIRETEALNDGLELLVVVTNNVFEDGIAYDDATVSYMKALGNVNGRLAAMADQVVEVVAGIPLTIKEKRGYADR